MKVPNFALAFGTEVPPEALLTDFAGTADGHRARGFRKKFEKKVAENFGNSKIGCNFAPFFGAFKTEATRSRTLKDLQ